MQISTINNNTYLKNNTNFTAKNPEIRFADDIARRVNQCFPRISPSNIADMSKINKFPELLERLSDKITSLRYRINLNSDYAIGFEDQLNAITNLIKKHKLGNCGESTLLAEIAARTNGIKDCQAVSLIQDKHYFFGFNLDHAALLVKNNNKPYIIDAWLGFADYLPNALKKYKNEYANHFNFRPQDKIKLAFTTIKHSLASDIFSQKYSQDELKYLYPELIVNSSTKKV